MANAAAVNLDLGSNLDDEPRAPFVPQPPAKGRVRIYLEEDESIPPTGLYVGHNGVSYMLQPGREMDIPVGVLSILDDAVITVPVIDPVSRKVIGHRSRRKYNYRLV